MKLSIVVVYGNMVKKNVL